jgi:hypothetical protein
MLRNGVDVFSLQKLMGHSDLQGLRRYLAQTDLDVHSAHMRGSPVDSNLLVLIFDNRKRVPNMNAQSKNLLRSVMRQLVIALELLNKIPENDFRELVKTAKTKKSDIKGILDNA